MRRTIGIVLLVLGFLGVALAVLLRFQVAPKLIAAPNDRYGVATLTGPSATYLDLATGRPVSAPMMITATTRSVTDQSTDEIAVWDSFTAVQRVSDEEVMSASEWRLAFDRRTAELKTCCSAHVNGNTAISQSGLGLMFPTNDRLEKKDYTRFDASTARTWKAEYVGEETVEGVKAYKFTQKIDGAVLGAPSDVPAYLFGAGAKGSVSAEKVYYSEVTVWVEPRTGSTVNQVQKIDTRLRNVADGTEVSALAGEFTFTDESRADLVSGTEDSLAKIQLLKLTGPLVLLLGGLVLIAGGVLLRRSPGRHQAGGRTPEPERAPEPV
ncbi:PorA family protein [Actinocorallia aurea]